MRKVQYCNFMNRDDAIEKLMRRAVENGVFPGGIISAARGEEVLLTISAGSTSIFEGGKKVMPDTVFDLASLTKPLATALAVMFLVAEKKVDLDDSIWQHLDRPHVDKKANITWQQLLCHNSGLPDYRPYYETLLGLPEKSRKEALFRMIIDEPLVFPPGTKTVYSDVGFLLLQFGIESVTGETLSAFVQDTLYPSLSVSGLFFPSYNDRGVDRLDYAASEVCPFRGLLQGVVHDENAFAIGGSAGHAGLFGTVDAVCLLLRKLMGIYRGEIKNRWLHPDVVTRFFTVPEGAQRTPGFDVCAPEGASCGKYFDKAHTIGHLGFTGTSFWMDLERNIVVILLTNRVHPSRENEKIKKFRPVIHDEIMRWIL